MVAETRDPAMERRRLRFELRKMRQDLGLKQTEVAEAMEWSPSKVIRIEHGDVNISAADLRVLVDYYGVASELERLLGMARAARQPSWEKYRNVHSKAYLTYLGLESSAHRIRTYEPILVPGLLQTEEYARAVLKGAYQNSDEDLALRWEARQRRQAVHERADPPDIAVVIDEAVIRRVVGGPRVMEGQLRRLREHALAAHVSLRLVPFAAGAHPGMRGPFVMLDFPDPEIDDFLFLEDSTGDSRSLDDPEEVAPYLERFFLLEELALSPDDTVSFVDRAIVDLDRSAGAKGG